MKPIMSSTALQCSAVLLAGVFLIGQTITLKDGTTKTETVTACRGPNGVTVL